MLASDTGLQTTGCFRSSHSRSVKRRFRIKRSVRIPLRTNSLVRVKVKITVKNAVCEGLRRQHTAGFDCDFGFDSQEWIDLIKANRPDEYLHGIPDT